MPANLCAICRLEARQTCSACNGVYYCSREHQKIDWKRHKSACAPYKVHVDAVMGRCLVATRPIQPGEVIMKKLPLVIGPKTASAPVCLGCNQRLKTRHDCAKCKWPLCDSVCETSPLHAPECAILSKSGFRPQIGNDDSKQTAYSIIAPLRALLLKIHDEKKYQTLIQCQSHLAEHRKTPLYEILRRILTPLLVDTLKLPTDEEEILNICSIFDTNCFEVRDAKGMVNVRGLYPTMALLAHSCRHNTKHSFHGEDLTMVLTATMPIEKGELITTTYTQSLWATLSRRAHLKMSKHFDCVCERCSDPSEFGTFIGSIYCTQCKRSDSRNLLISCDCLNQNAMWKCDVCGYSMSGKQMMCGNEELKKEIALLDKRKPDGLEAFLVKYQEILPPRNSHLLQIKYALSQMYGNLKGYELEELSSELLVRKIELCHELLDVAEELEPGHSRFRGSLLYDLQAAMVAKAQMDFAQEVIDRDQAEDILKKAIDYLQEAACILKTEPDLMEVLQKRLQNLHKIASL